MTAPAHTARTQPPAHPLYNGHQTVLALSLDPDLSLWEKTIMPMGVDNGDKVDQTTQWNARYRTYAPRALLEMTDGEMTFAFHPAMLPQVIAVAGKVGSMTQYFPDGSYYDFYGYLKGVKVDALVEGTQPGGTATLVITNLDASGVEVGPVYNAGTTTTPA